jgi:hypothetical protein
LRLKDCSFRVETANEATLQSFDKTTINRRSNLGKAIIAFAWCDRYRFILESYSAGSRSSAAELFHRPHAPAYSDFAEDRQIHSKGTGRLFPDRPI